MPLNPIFSSLDDKPRRELWRETVFFLDSFVATMGASVVLMNHAAAVMA